MSPVDDLAASRVFRVSTRGEYTNWFLASRKGIKGSASSNDRWPGGLDPAKPASEGRGADTPQAPSPEWPRSTMDLLELLAIGGSEISATPACGGYGGHQAHGTFTQRCSCSLGRDCSGLMPCQTASTIRVKDGRCLFGWHLYAGSAISIQGSPNGLTNRERAQSFPPWTRRPLLPSTYFDKVFQLQGQWCLVLIRD